MVDEHGYKIPNPSSAPGKSGCIIISTIIAILLSLPVFCFGAPYLSHVLEFHNAYNLWSSKSIDDYAITIEMLGLGGGYQIVITVRDNIIVEVQDESTLDQGYHPSLDSYSYLLIDRLFNRARNCYTFCEVSYDSEYGIPNYVYGGFIESAGYRVIDFEPLTFQD